MKSSRISAFAVAAAALLPSCLAGIIGVPVRHDASWEPEYVLVATAQNVTINCQSRYSTVFNGTSPGPTIHLQEGRSTWVRVWNRIENDNVTVHWHGLTQRVAPFADGTPSISQWPIAPDQFFDYELHPERGDAGTYFYHSHVGFQGVTARGVLIVDKAEDAEKPYEYDDDITLAFGDYYAREDEDIVRGLTSNPFKWAGEPAAVVLNDRTGNASMANAADDSCKPYVITVEPGKTYRMRFIGQTALSFLMVGIEGHEELDIIEADGHYTKPTRTDRVQIGSGQRFSALLRTKSKEELRAEGKQSYWIRYEAQDRPQKPWGWALLQYKTSKTCNSTLPDDLPKTNPVPFPTDLSVYTRWLEDELEAAEPDGKFPTLSEVTRTVYIQVNQHLVDGFFNGSVVGGLEWVQNNLSWTEADHESDRALPYLINAYMGGQAPDYDAAMANNGWDPKTRAWPAKVGEVLDIVWVSNSGPTSGFDAHPIHAHGEHYYDLGSGNGTYNAEENEKKFANHTPVRRDTTMLYRYMPKSSVPNYTAGWRAWRIRITEDNVGAWMLHCHVIGHMVMGMQTVWVFGDTKDILKEIPHPYLDGYLNYGGSAYGNDSFDPMVMHFFDQKK